MASMPDRDTLRITEIFHSIQGESTRVGLPCVFVRLTGCPLRCAYCDTEYAFTEGTSRLIEDVVAEVLDYQTPLVELTGGEPLIQPRVHVLEQRLLDQGVAVLIETSGAYDISPCDERSIVVMDIKTPSSGESERMDWENIARLRPHHEVKFVIGSREDYEYATSTIEKHELAQRTACVLLSPVHEQPKGLHIAGQRGLDAKELVGWMLEDHLDARLQLQIHKFIWDPATRGV